MLSYRGGEAAGQKAVIESRRCPHPGGQQAEATGSFRKGSIHMRKHHKRIFSFLLSFVMGIGLMPATAHAAERPSAAPLNKETIDRKSVV